jgi:hypothetical protein
MALRRPVKRERPAGSPRPAVRDAASEPPRLPKTASGSVFRFGPRTGIVIP